MLAHWQAPNLAPAQMSRHLIRHLGILGKSNVAGCRPTFGYVGRYFVPVLMSFWISPTKCPCVRSSWQSATFGRCQNVSPFSSLPSLQCNFFILLYPAAALRHVFRHIGTLYQIQCRDMSLDIQGGLLQFIDMSSTSKKRHLCRGQLPIHHSSSILQCCALLRRPFESCAGTQRFRGEIHKVEPLKRLRYSSTMVPVHIPTQTMNQATRVRVLEYSSTRVLEYSRFEYSNTKLNFNYVRPYAYSQYNNRSIRVFITVSLENN